MKKTYLHSWEQSRRELLARIMAAFAEARMECEAKKLAKEEREKQLEVCRGLAEKVSQLVYFYTGFHTEGGGPRDSHNPPTPPPPPPEL